MLNRIIILGKLPPPYYGPAIATNIILKSALNDEFELIHVDTRLNTEMQTMGKFSFSKSIRLFSISIDFIKKINRVEDGIVLIPFSQSNGFIKDYLFYILAKWFNKKVILHLRGSAILEWYNNTNTVMKSIYRSMVTGSDAAIVLGEKLKYLFEPFMPEEKIHVVPNGANYPMLENIKRVPKSKVRILYFANLQESKGVGDLIDAINLLETKIFEVIEVNICGSWIAKSEFMNSIKIKINQLNGRIKIFDAKWEEAKFEQFRESDIFIFPPNKPEGHPWVIVEALAAGLPIISTDQGAITESVIDNHNGYIVPSASPSNLAAAIKKLVLNPELRLSMGENSRNHYLENFTENNLVENFSRVFNSVLQK